MRKAIFLLLISVWIIISFFNIFYNAYKTIFEIKEWGNLSEHEKREKIFGNLYLFLVNIDSHTDKNATIIIFSRDLEPFYLGRYFLYPKILISVNTKKELIELTKNKKVKYIAMYNTSFNPSGYEKITLNSGVLYRLK